MMAFPYGGIGVLWQMVSYLLVHTSGPGGFARLQVVTYVLYFGMAYFWLPLQLSAPGTQSPVLFALEPLTLR